MDIYLLVLSIVCFVAAIGAFLASGATFQKNDKGWVSFVVGIGFLGVGIALFFNVSHNYGKRDFASDEYGKGEMAVNEPYKTVHALGAKTGDSVLLICKMYADARYGKTLKAGVEVAEVVLYQTDCEDPDNWTAYLLEKKTPPLFIKRSTGEYQSITEAEASFLKKSLY